MGNILYPDFGNVEAVEPLAPTTGLRKGLKVTYTEPLKDYLVKKGCRDILIASYRPHGNMAFPEEDIHPINRDRAIALMYNGTPYIEGEIGKVFLSHTWIPDDPHATIRLSLQSYFGIKVIKAEGLKRLELLRNFESILNVQE